MVVCIPLSQRYVHRRHGGVCDGNIGRENDTQGVGRPVMELKGEAKLLRIFVGEADKHHHLAMYESIVKEARAAGLAGATAWRGAMSFGASSRIRSIKVLDLSSDLPMIVEI